MLTFTDVTKRYSKVTAVDRLSFSIDNGEIFSLLGPNGAGKTTSLRMIMQIIKPDSGYIRFGPSISAANARIPGPYPSIPASNTADRTRLGYLPEERGLYQDAIVIKNLVYLATLRGKDPAWARKKGIEWLDRFGLKDRMNDKVSTLSKGNQQKVQFITSILHEPDFVVLDEPFSGFDPINQELISDCIRELRDGGMTILLSAHQMQLVERIADRILLINNGRELVSGTLSEIHKKTVSDTKILVQFSGDTDASKFDSIPHIRGFQLSSDGHWEFFLDDASSLNDILNGLASAGNIISLKTTEANLHDIFIQSFTNDNQGLSVKGQDTFDGQIPGDGQSSGQDQSFRDGHSPDDGQIPGEVQQSIKGEYPDKNPGTSKSQDTAYKKQSHLHDDKDHTKGGQQNA